MCCNINGLESCPPGGQIYRKASISQIHERIGKEIPRRKLRFVLKELVDAGDLRLVGTR